jgi:hypothetical protein
MFAPPTAIYTHGPGLNDSVNFVQMQAPLMWNNNTIKLLTPFDYFDS